MTRQIEIQAMKLQDLAQVMIVQREVFEQDLCEEAEVFENRFEVFGQYFRVAVDEQKNIIGYMLCFPWKLGESPVNNEKFPADLPEFNCFYLHDICVLPSYRGKGVAKQMIGQAKEMARKSGYECLSLVAVEQSGQYWDHLGFTPIKNLSATKMSFIHRVYGSAARLMALSLAKTP